PWPVQVSRCLVAAGIDFLLQALAPGAPVLLHAQAVLGLVRAGIAQVRGDGEREHGLARGAGLECDQLRGAGRQRVPGVDRVQRGVLQIVDARDREQAGEAGGADGDAAGAGACIEERLRRADGGAVALDAGRGAARAVAVGLGGGERGLDGVADGAGGLRQGEQRAGRWGPGDAVHGLRSTRWPLMVTLPLACRVMSPPACRVMSPGVWTWSTLCAWSYSTRAPSGYSVRVRAGLVL